MSIVHWTAFIENEDITRMMVKKYVNDNSLINY